MRFTRFITIALLLAAPISAQQAAPASPSAKPAPSASATATPRPVALNDAEVKEAQRAQQAVDSATAAAQRAYANVLSVDLYDAARTVAAVGELRLAASALDAANYQKQLVREKHCAAHALAGCEYAPEFQSLVPPARK